MGASLLNLELSGVDLSQVVGNLADSVMHRPLGLLLLVGLYLLRPVLLPAGALTLTVGMLFGPLRGVLYATLGSTSAALLAYGLARYLGEDWTVPMRLEPYRERLATHGFVTVTMPSCFCRTPTSPVRYLTGLVGVRLGSFVAATLLGTLPVTAFIVGLGAAVPLGSG